MCRPRSFTRQKPVWSQVGEGGRCEWARWDLIATTLPTKSRPCCPQMPYPRARWFTSNPTLPVHGFRLAHPWLPPCPPMVTTAAIMHVPVPMAGFPGFEGPRAGPSTPVWAPFRLRRSALWTLSACLGPIPASKVRSLDPQRLFGPHSGFEGPFPGPSGVNKVPK